MMVVDGPLTASRCARMRLLQISDKGAVREPDYPHWNGYVEAFFQLHGVDTAERPVLRRKLRRKENGRVFCQAATDRDRDGGLRCGALLGACCVSSATR